MRPELTPKQQRFFHYLAARLERTGEAPSLREAATDLGISHGAVAQLLKALEEKGYLRRQGRYSRTIRILDEAPRPAGVKAWRELPVIGRIAAGLPLYAQQQWEETVIVDAELFQGQNLFGLRVRGDSMQEAGILDGDLVICTPRQYAHNGEIVVALLHEEEATVKRFFLVGDQIELRPENRKYAPRRYNFAEVLIQGKVIGVQRGPEQIR